MLYGLTVAGVMVSHIILFSDYGMDTSRGFVELKCLYLHAFHTKKRFVVNQVTDASLDFASRFIFLGWKFLFYFCAIAVTVLFYA